MPSNLQHKRVLALTPASEESTAIRKVLGAANIRLETCGDVAQLVERAEQGTEVVLLAAETIDASASKQLFSLIETQPAWSDLPFILLSSQQASQRKLKDLKFFLEEGNVTILERPLNAPNLLRAVQSALRARRRQLELRGLIEQHEGALNSINDSFVMLDSDWRFIYVNQRAADMYGVSREEILGKKKWEVAPEYLNTVYFRSLQRAAKEKKELQAEFFHPRSNRWFEKRVYPSTQGITIFSTDITERKTVEENLRYQLGITRAITENAADSFFLLDAEGRVTFMNPAAEKTLGWKREELVGRFLHDFVHKHPNSKKKRECALHSILTTGLTLCELEDRFYKKDGSTIHVSCSNAAIIIHGRITGAVLVVHDITYHKLAQGQLKALNETLERRVAERTRVAERRSAQLRALASELTQTEQRERRRLAHILHDSLQQMLVATKLQVGTLRQRLTDDDIREALNQVEDLLARSIAESRSLTVELSPPILYDGGLHRALEWLSRRMQTEHHLQVHLECDEGVEPSGDDVRAFLFQAIREFLFNTVKHAGVGEATIKVRRMSSDQACITVSDEGMGFDASNTKSEGGFGLFSIRERLELLGGRLEIESSPGNGTRASLHVPLSPPELSPPEEQDLPANRRPGHRGSKADDWGARPKNPDAIRVLLADDHKMLRDGLATLLQDQPDIVVVSEASDGLMAVELAHQTKPDIIIMDIAMPHLNGVEATRRIRKELPDIKVVGLSMHEKEDMANAMREAGAVDYITKGSASEKLTATIRTYCRKNARATAPAAVK